MKEKLRFHINALRIIDQLPSCDLKDQQIDDVLNDIVKLGIEIVDFSSRGGRIDYRGFAVNDSEECFDVSVKIIQTYKDDLIIIDANFGDEE